MNLNRKVSIEQALRIVKANKKELFVKDVTKDLDEASQFILSLGIRNGKIRVPAKIVYKAYNQWALNPIKKERFSKQFAALIPLHQSGADYYYLLNYHAVELLKETSK